MPDFWLTAQAATQARVPLTTDVMRARNVIVGLTVGILAGAAALSLSSPGIQPVKVRLVGTRALNSSGSRAITLEFTRSEEPGIYLVGDPSVQLRIAKHWQAPLKLPKIRLLSQTNQQRLVLTVPSETEACRFLVGYRVYRSQHQGRRPYCRVYAFLQRHGLRARYPKLSGLVLKCFVPRLRHSNLELTLPEQQVTSRGRHNRCVQAAPDGGLIGVLAWMHFLPKKWCRRYRPKAPIRSSEGCMPHQACDGANRARRGGG